MSVVKTGFYRFSTDSHINTYGYIYKDNFNPLNPFENILLQDDNSCSDNQFGFYTHFQIGITYVLVVTTYRPNVTGEFSIQITGPKNIYVKAIREYLYHLINNQHKSAKCNKCL